MRDDISQIWIDKELVNLVEYKIGLAIDIIVEDYLKALVYYDDKESKVIRDFVKTSAKLDKIRSKFINQLKYKKLDYADELVETPLKILERINSTLGYVGLNQINNIAKANKVKASSLHSLCVEKGFVIVNHAAGVR